MAKRHGKKNPCGARPKKEKLFTFIFPHQFYLPGFAEQSAFAEESPIKLSATQVTKRAN